MNRVNLIDVEFKGFPSRKNTKNIFETLHPFNFEFVAGQSYLLHTKPGEGGQALSWIMGGLLNPTSGVIRLNEKIYTARARKRDAWCIRESEIRRFWVGNQTVAYQIRTGLKNNREPYLKTEDEIIRRFSLIPERYHRPLSQLSHEAWRASCAIGLAWGKKIFCFPFMENDLISTYRDLWLKQMIDLLRDSGALVLLPATAIEISSDLCDEIVSLE